MGHRDAILPLNDMGDGPLWTKAEVERQRPRAVLCDTCMHVSRPWRIGADMPRGIARAPLGAPACRILPHLCSGGLHDMTAARNQGFHSCGEVLRSRGALQWKRSER